MKCLECGRFVKNVRCVYDMDKTIHKVEGFCSIHGAVDLTNADWSWDDFFPEPTQGAQGDK